MHSVHIFDWDTNEVLHSVLIGLNFALWLSLMIRFEFPLIRRRLARNERSVNDLRHAGRNGMISLPEDTHTHTHNHNMLHNPSNTATNTTTTTGTTTTNHTANSHNTLLPAPTANTKTLGIEIILNPPTPNSNSPTPIPNTPPEEAKDAKYLDQPAHEPQHGGFPSTTSLAGLPSQLHEIQLTKVPSGAQVFDVNTNHHHHHHTNTEQEQKYEPVRHQGDDHEQVKYHKRRRVSIEFYRQLFHWNYEGATKLVSSSIATQMTPPRSQSQRDHNQPRMSYRHTQNDSTNLLEHQKRMMPVTSFNEDDFHAHLSSASPSPAAHGATNGATSSSLYVFDRPRNTQLQQEATPQPQQQSLAAQLAHAHDDNYYNYMSDDVETVDAYEDVDTLHTDLLSYNEMQFSPPMRDLNPYATANNARVDLVQLLKSKIYDSPDRSSVRNRYRCILYFPLLVFIAFGGALLCVIEHRGTNNRIDASYTWLMYAYPLLQVVLSLVLCSQIDIVILSCGGAHIIEECLEVQISADDNLYKCIYCCWCNCACLNVCKCNACTHDNAYSLFKCHLALLKALMCVACPLLSCIFFVISEIESVNEYLHATKIGAIHQTLNTPINDEAVYWLIFLLVCAIDLIFLITATAVGIRIVRSLHSLSSLTPRTLTWQYVTSVVITFGMQTQFIVLLLYLNLTRAPYDDNELLAATPFYLLLVYIEFIVVSLWNHFAFRNVDFDKFGQDSIKKNEVQLFDFKPEYDKIHDLRNYRSVYGTTFMYDVDDVADEPRVAGDESDEDAMPTHHPQVSATGNYSFSRNTLALGRNKKKKTTTPLITKSGVITVEERPASTRAQKRIKQPVFAAPAEINTEDVEVEEEVDDDGTSPDHHVNDVIKLESVIDDDVVNGGQIRSRPQSTRQQSGAAHNADNSGSSMTLSENDADSTTNHDNNNNDDATDHRHITTDLISLEINVGGSGRSSQKNNNNATANTKI